MNTTNHTKILNRIAGEFIEAELKEQRAALGKAMEANEARHKRDMPILQRADDEARTRYRKVQAELEKLFPSASAAEQALSSERVRYDREASSLAEQAFERASPALVRLYNASRILFEGFHFDPEPPVPGERIIGQHGPTNLWITKPGYKRPVGGRFEAAAAIRGLFEAMHKAEQDVPVIQAAFYAAAPERFGSAVRDRVAAAEGAPPPAPLVIGPGGVLSAGVM